MHPSQVDNAAILAEIDQLKQQIAEKEALIMPEGGFGKRPKKKSQLNRIETDPVQGCRDFPPETMRLRDYLFSTFDTTARLYGFEKYDAPVLESELLYLRKSGEEIADQMYHFITPNGHRVALRPEMTPSLARLLLSKGRSLLLPAKWYAIPQCWRYETITRGRRREHYQWNMDIIGVSSISAEVELVCAACAAMSSLGLTAKDVGVRVSSRKVLQAVMESVGVKAEAFNKVCVVVDKMDKLPKEEIVRQLEEIGVGKEGVGVIVETLGGVKSVEEMEKRLGDGENGENGVKELKEFFAQVKAYGYGDWVSFDASVVRGLAYYTGIVFEGFDREGKFRAICGGGRYDHLLSLYGSPQPVPCAGFGFGDCVIMELLEEKKLLPTCAHKVDDVVIPFNETMREHALTVLKQLRDGGRRADIILDKKKVSQAFHYADRVGADRAVLVAPEEWDKGQVQIKMLREGKGKEDAEANAQRGQSIPLEKLLD